MNGDRVLSHVENLVPGLTTLLILAALVPAGFESPVKNPWVVKALSEPVILALFLIATAYLSGAVIFLISRGIINTVSALTLRWVFLWFRYSDLRGMPWEINKAYRSAIESASYGPGIPPNDTREVNKRRERARLIRTALIPALLAASKYPNRAWAVLVAFLLIVLVYAYAEVAIYQEARMVLSGRSFS